MYDVFYAHIPAVLQSIEGGCAVFVRTEMGNFTPLSTVRL